MNSAAGKVLGVTVGSTATVFLVVLAGHVAAAMTALGSGVLAALSAKGSTRHVFAGRVYFRALITVFGTALVLTAMRPRQDWYLALTGAVALAAAWLGIRHRRVRRSGDTGHIVAMGASLAAVLTAFYVDNGPHLPAWDHLPTVAFWLLPGTVAAALVMRSVRRHL